MLNTMRTIKSTYTKIKPIMKKLLFAFVLFQSSFIICAAQQTNLDSLYTVWQDPNQPDSTRVIAYQGYIWKGYLFSQPDTAEVLAETLHDFANKHNLPRASATGFQLMGIANHIKGNYNRALECYQNSMTIWEELGNKNGIAGILANIGIIYKYQGDYPRALEYYHKALEINEEIRFKKGVATSLNNIGIIYYEKGKYPRALEYYQKSLAIHEEIGDKQSIASSLNNIGGIYYDKGNYHRALEYYQKSLAICEKIGDKKGMAASLNNIGSTYNYLGNYPSAIEYYQKSLAINEELGDKEGTAGSLDNIGILYKEQGNYPLALECNQKSLAICEKIGDKKGIATSLNSIGTLFQKQSKNDFALDYCKKGLAMAEDIGALKQQKIACQCLYDSYKTLGKGNDALVYLEKLNVITDSLHAEETTKKLEQMEFAKVMMQDSIAKAEEARLVQEAHQEEMRAEEKTRNVAFGVGAFVLLLAGGLYSRLRYVRKSKAIVEKEKDRSNNLLLNILPADIAEELKIHGKAEARDFDMVSILFTDFKGFTEASAKLSAQELVSEINTCFKAFDGIMEKHKIEKIKTIGDAYMAAGGLPVPTDDSVKNTVLAALEMQDFIEARKKTKEERGEAAFEMRVGIHTSPVVAGIVGVKKFQYDIWGDTVNTASRMESSGEVGKVNISQATYELLKDASTSSASTGSAQPALSLSKGGGNEIAEFVFEPRGKIQAKGKGEMEMYFVKRVKS